MTATLPMFPPALGARTLPAGTEAVSVAAPSFHLDAAVPHDAEGSGGPAETIPKANRDNVARPAHPAAGSLMTRRSIVNALVSVASVSAAAAVAPPTLAAGAQPSDPIFAAIEKHRAAWRAYEALCIDQSRLEESLPQDQTRWNPRRDDRCTPPPDGTHPDWARVVIANRAAWDAHLDATLEMIHVAPTTIAGAIALLRYFHDHVSVGGEWPADLVDDVDDPDAEERPCSWFLHRHVADALAEIANAAA